MKEFRIGQRVRIIRAARWSGVKGRVATILSKGFISEGVWVQEVDVEGCPSPTSKPWVGPPDHMEPIDDDKGDWRVIEHLTKWNPYKVAA